jgi:hypothetical protein
MIFKNKKENVNANKNYKLLYASQVRWTDDHIPEEGA